MMRDGIKVTSSIFSFIHIQPNETTRENVFHGHVVKFVFYGLLKYQDSDMPVKPDKKIIESIVNTVVKKYDHKIILPKGTTKQDKLLQKYYANTLNGEIELSIPRNLLIFVDGYRHNHILYGIINDIETELASRLGGSVDYLYNQIFKFIKFAIVFEDDSVEFVRKENQEER